MLKARSFDGINRLMAAIPAGQLQMPIKEQVTEGDKILKALPNDLKRLRIVIEQKCSALEQLSAEHLAQHLSGNQNPAECNIFKKMVEEEVADIKFFQDLYWREIKMCAGQSDNLAVKSSSQGDVIVELDTSADILDKTIDDFLRGPFGFQKEFDSFSDDDLGFFLPGGRRRISLMSIGDLSSPEQQPPSFGSGFKSLFSSLKLRR